MLENVSEAEIKLQKENDELRAKIARTVFVIDEVIAFEFTGKAERIICEDVVRPVLREVKALLQCQ